MDTLDTRGLSCPQPVLLVKKALDAQGGGTLSVLADSDASRENICRLAESAGWTARVEVQEPGLFSIMLNK
jgi:TusA-related sulfurtransferase